MFTIFFGFVHEVDFEDTLVATTNFDIANEDVFDEATTAIACLDTNDTIELWAIHFAIFDPKVFKSARDFAS